MKTEITGNIIVVGNNIDTDQIYPGRFLAITDPKEIGSHCLCGVDENIATNFPQGGIVVAGTNFGCGSSREHAPLAIKCAGVSYVIAETFARIFYRNSINIGLAIVECPEAVDAISEGDTVEADLDNGIIRDVTNGKEFHVAPFPEFIQTIIANGGLIESIKKGAVK